MSAWKAFYGMRRKPLWCIVPKTLLESSGPARNVLMSARRPGNSRKTVRSWISRARSTWRPCTVSPTHVEGPHFGKNPFTVVRTMQCLTNWPTEYNWRQGFFTFAYICNSSKVIKNDLAGSTSWSLLVSSKPSKQRSVCKLPVGGPSETSNQL